MAEKNGSLTLPAEGVDFERKMAETERRYLQTALGKSARCAHACRGAAEDQLPVVPALRQEAQYLKDGDLSRTFCVKAMPFSREFQRSAAALLWVAIFD